jgi:hypothetical protein
VIDPPEPADDRIVYGPFGLNDAVIVWFACTLVNV